MRVAGISKAATGGRQRGCAWHFETTRSSTGRSTNRNGITSWARTVSRPAKSCQGGVRAATSCRCRRRGGAGPKRALRAEIDETAWAELNSTISRSFARPRRGLICVKVINHFGDEVQKVFKV
jgi:hypothetical protein